jgi:rhamnosyltransferase
MVRRNPIGCQGIARPASRGRTSYDATLMSTDSLGRPVGCVTILLCTLNGERWLDAQLRSLTAQSYHDWRLLVADDGSTDRTLQILEEWCDREPRLSVVASRSPAERLGPAAAYLDLLGRVDTPWWAFCDQDDVWFPDRLDVGLGVVARLASDRPGVACTDAIATAADLSVRRVSVVSDRGRLRPGRVQPTTVALQNRAIGMTMTGNAAAARLATSRPELCGEAAMHDWWVALVTAAGGSLVYVDKPTVWYRQHDTNVTGSRQGLGSRVTRLRRRSMSARTSAIVSLAARQAGAVRELSGSDWPKELDALADMARVDTAPMMKLARLGRHGVRLASPLGEALMVLGGSRRDSTAKLRRASGPRTGEARSGDHAGVSDSWTRRSGRQGVSKRASSDDHAGDAGPLRWRRTGVRRRPGPTGAGLGLDERHRRSQA